MFVYLVCILEQNEEYIQNSYSFLTLVSWFGLLQQLRIFEPIRIFIELVQQTVFGLTSFLLMYVVLVVMAFILAFYQLNKRSIEGEETI
jgi:hypothetical protein